MLPISAERPEKLRLGIVLDVCKALWIEKSKFYEIMILVCSLSDEMHVKFYYCLT